jgi:hypothetical protein
MNAELFQYLLVRDAFAAFDSGDGFGIFTLLFLGVRLVVERRDEQGVQRGIGGEARKDAQRRVRGFVGKTIYQVVKLLL